MKEERYNFKCQNMYAQYYMLYNTRNQNDRRTNHTPGNNPFMEITIRYYQKSSI